MDLLEDLPEEFTFSEPYNGVKSNPKQREDMTPVEGAVERVLT